MISVSLKILVVNSKILRCAHSRDIPGIFVRKINTALLYNCLHNSVSCLCEFLYLVEFSRTKYCATLKAAFC